MRIEEVWQIVSSYPYPLEWQRYNVQPVTIKETRKGGERMIPLGPIFQAVGAVVDLVIEAIEAGSDNSG